MVEGPAALSGVTVVVTRAKTQASVLSEWLVALGADAIPIATIEIAAPADGGQALRSALQRATSYQQIAVASPNGARILAEVVALLEAASEIDVDQLPPVACVGPSTAAKLRDSPLQVNVVPDRAVAEGLVDALPAPEPGASLLLVQAEVARDVLENGLRAAGWDVDRVTAYRTIDAEVTDADRLAARRGDVVTFTSSSTVERFVRLVGRDAVAPVVASIGPITSQTARDLGLTVDIEADPHTIAGLVDALVTWAADRTP